MTRSCEVGEGPTDNVLCRFGWMKTTFLPSNCSVGHGFTSNENGCGIAWIVNCKVQCAVPGILSAFTLQTMRPGKIEKC
jgi:hypothetical protein